MSHLRLVLIRHAKAADAYVDAERPLAPRGARDAAAIGPLLAEAGIESARVVVSPARRARETWDAARPALSGDIAEIVDERIYANNVETLFDVIRETPPDSADLILVGHNPSFADLAFALDDGEGDAAARREMRVGFPPSTVVIFDADGEWTDARERWATLRAFAVARAA